jgi:hypothetical protein
MPGSTDVTRPGDRPGADTDSGQRRTSHHSALATSSVVEECEQRFGDLSGGLFGLMVATGDEVTLQAL